MNEFPSTNKILIIDDNPHNRELLIAIVEMKGFSFDQAENGKEAFALLERNSYWLAFIDLLMPEIDGFETIRTMRSRGFDFPIVAVSAISFKQDRQAAFEAGCDHFIPKPIDMDLVHEMIDQYWTLFQSKVSQTEEAHSGSALFEKPQPALDQSRFSPDYQDICVYLVEADASRRNHFSVILKDTGCRLQPFENGADAWQTINSQEAKPDIVISNIHMPEIDGLALLTMVKRTFPDILFFLYTPSFDNNTIQLAFKQGVDNIIPLELFETAILDNIASGLSHAKSDETQSTAPTLLQQVSKVQEQLIQIGCESSCSFCDIAYSSLLEAGGDFAVCRNFNLEGRCGIVLIDVAGHDIVSSYLSAMFWGVLSSNWNEIQNPDQLTAFLNQELYRMGFRDSHVCLTAFLWDPNRRQLSISIAGNPGETILDSNGTNGYTIKATKGGGMVLGMLPELDEFCRRTLVLPSSCVVLFHSDGIDQNKLLPLLKELYASSSNPLKDLSSQFLLDQYIARYSQTDDIIIVKLFIPPPGQEDVNHTIIPSDYESIDYACKWAEDKISKPNLPSGYDSYDILACIREALLNSVEHGNQGDPKRLINLNLLPGINQLTVRISDEGPGFNLAEKLHQAAMNDGLQIGKRGLPMIQSITTHFETKGGSVILEFQGK